LDIILKLKYFVQPLFQSLDSQTWVVQIPHERGWEKYFSFGDKLEEKQFLLLLMPNFPSYQKKSIIFKFISKRQYFSNPFFNHYITGLELCRFLPKRGWENYSNFWDNLKIIKFYFFLETFSCIFLFSSHQSSNGNIS